MIVTILRNNIDFEAVILLMDNTIREELHKIADGWTEQEFANEYCRRHRVKFGQDFRCE